MIGMHATKARWVPDTLRDGLSRCSAAWFVGAEIDETTVAAAVYLGLGRSGRQQLLAGVAYADVLRQAQALLPALILFEDHPTGTETWHRYRWADGPSCTARYTKVERAGRRVALAGRSAVVALGADEAQAVAAGLGRSDGDHELLIRVGCSDWAAPAGVFVAASPMAEFCRRTAKLLLPRVRAARLEGNPG